MPKIKHIQSIDISPPTISWLKNEIVDWQSAGDLYSVEGKMDKRVGRYHFAFSFDVAITSKDGQYAFLYKKLGTKGILLKDGELLREINRSYYHAETYEYPACFLTLENGKTYLVHCPLNYCRLDFEDVETGEIMTNDATRKPDDFFHSRLEISPNNKYLLSKGWVWHPVECVSVFDIEKSFEDPTQLDKPYITPNVNFDINTASFIHDDLILLGASNGSEPFDEEDTVSLNKGQIGLWDLTTNTINIVNIKGEFGNLYAIDDNFAWDLYKFPKLINLKTGDIIDKIETINSGLQASSIIHHLDFVSQICFNRDINTIAILSKEYRIDFIGLEN